jgi:LAGLIDADG DNA endonuclease family protein
MISDNPMGADHQQGRSQGILSPDYVAGFIDGEGCFCVSIHPHPSVEQPERWLFGHSFQAYQHRDNVGILEKLRDFFGCGRISAKGPNSHVMTYSVYRRADLVKRIIPFFDVHPLISRKQEDFMKFREIVLAMTRKEHRTEEGFKRLVELGFSMNQRGKQRRYAIEEVLRNPQRLHAEQ